MIKLIALDIDGTVLGSNQKISKVTCDVLHTCEEKGIEWMLVTGRNYDIVKPILEDHGLQCDCILNSGHEYVTRSGKQEHFVAMNNDILKQVLMVLLEYGYHMSIHTNEGKYIFGSKEDYFEEHLSIAKMKHNSDLKELAHSALFNKEKFLYNTHEVNSVEELLASGVKVLKIDARNFDLDKVRESLPMIKKLDNIIIHSSYEAFIEISDTTSNKAMMLLDVIKEKGIQQDEVCVFGDSMNDLEMFEQFEHSFAMENANDKIKRHAKWITDTNNNDGVAKGIMRILRNQL